MPLVQGPRRPRSSPSPDKQWPDGRAASAARVARGVVESPWLWLGIGLLLAPLFGFAPLLSYMGWFVSALVHEMGHCVAALFTGHSAHPVIRLDGHAMAQHGRQHAVLVWGTWIGLAGLAYWLRERRAWCIAVGVLALVYPVFAWTDFGELFHLLAGGLGELAFAVIALSRCYSGGFTHNNAERAVYGMLGFYLVGSQIGLCTGILGDAYERHRYLAGGSFGLTNDYVRAADLLGWDLDAIVMLMLVASFIAVGLGILIGWRIHRGP